MSAQVSDRLLLILSIILVLPLIILAFLTVAIGFPLHLVKKSIFSKMGIANAKD
jgi:hypothetical protein